MDNMGVDLSPLDWDTRSRLSSFSGSRSSTFSNTGSHSFVTSGLILKDVFFSDQNWTVDKELAQLATLCHPESGQDKAKRRCQVKSF